ncbi:MAG: cation transporter dimerization domain-containing protein, partial [Planctomycetota bacterium]
VAGTQGVRGFHAFRARRLGGKVEMDVHVQVDPNLTVREGHDIASAVKHAAMGADQTIIAVVVHVEPAEEKNE